MRSITTKTDIPLYNKTTNKGNYDKTSFKKDRVVIHTMAGSMEGTNAWFHNENAKVSANYGVSLKGEIVKWVEEHHTSYHSGNYEYNKRSIGIEHEDGTSSANPQGFNKPRPDALYSAAAELLEDVCYRHGIPLDREHVVKHSEVKKSTSCCGTLDIDRIVREAQAVRTARTSVIATPIAAPVLLNEVFYQIPNKGDINPVNGKTYATNPITNQWDDTYWAERVEPEIKKRLVKLPETPKIEESVQLPKPPELTPVVPTHELEVPGNIVTHEEEVPELSNKVLLTKAINFDKICSFFQLSEEDRMKPDSGDIIIDRITKRYMEIAQTVKQSTTVQEIQFTPALFESGWISLLNSDVLTLIKNLFKGGQK